MKNRILLLSLVLIALNSSGQTAQPCAILDQNRDISGMRQILMRDGVYYENLRASYAEAINCSVGKRIFSSSKSDMEEILDNTILVDQDFVVPSEYYNGVRNGNNINFTSLAGQPSSSWAAYRYEGVDIIYAKVSCMNPQKAKKPHFLLEEKSVKKGNTAFSAPTTIKEMVMSPINYQTPASVYVPPVENKFNWKPVLVIGGFTVVAVGAGLLVYSLMKKSISAPVGSPVGAPGHDDPGGPVGAPGHDDLGGPAGVRR